jgi:hypothetical protein
VVTSFLWAGNKYVVCATTHLHSVYVGNINLFDSNTVRNCVLCFDLFVSKPVSGINFSSSLEKFCSERILTELLDESHATDVKQRSKIFVGYEKSRTNS